MRAVGPCAIFSRSHHPSGHRRALSRYVGNLALCLASSLTALRSQHSREAPSSTVVAPSCLRRAHLPEKPISDEEFQVSGLPMLLHCATLSVCTRQSARLLGNCVEDVSAFRPIWQSSSPLTLRRFRTILTCTRSLKSSELRK